MTSKSMIVSISLLVAMLQGALAAEQHQQQQGGRAYAAHRPTFLLLGDSLTEFGYGSHWKYKTSEKGWVALLSELYSRKADIVNRGMAGYNSRWGLQVLPQALADFGCSPNGGRQQTPRNAFFSWRAQPQQQQHCNVQLMVIWFGANDAVDNTGSDGRLRVPLEEYKKNLAAMVAAAKRAGVQEVVLVTPPPVDEQKWASERNLTVSDRRNAALTKYAAAAREVASQLGAPLLDVHTAFSLQQEGTQQTVKEGLLNDGVHFAPAGQQLVFSSLKDLLDSNPGLSGVRPNEMPNHYPLFNQVDEANPRHTFDELFEKQLVQPTTKKAGGGNGPTEQLSN